MFSLDRILVPYFPLIEGTTPSPTRRRFNLMARETTKERIKRVSRGRGVPCCVYFFPEEYELLLALSKSYNETPAQTLRRLMHEKVDQCATEGEVLPCAGWKRAEKLRGALLAMRGSIDDLLNSE